MLAIGFWRRKLPRESGPFPDRRVAEDTSRKKYESEGGVSWDAQKKAGSSKTRPVVIACACKSSRRSGAGGSDRPRRSRETPGLSARELRFRKRYLREDCRQNSRSIQLEASGKT